MTHDPTGLISPRLPNSAHGARARRWIAAGALALAALGATACGGEDPTGLELIDAAPDASFMDVVLPDAALPADTAPPVDTAPAPDTAPPVDTATAPDTASPADTEPPADTAPPVDTAPPEDTASPADTAPPLDTTDPGPAPGPWGFACDQQGGQGCACAALADCKVGLTCADTLLGRFCAEPCLSTCAGGRRCASAAQGFNICLPAWSTLCAPCEDPQDCLELGALCVDFGYPGSYCAPPCTAAGTCPAGFQCSTLGAAGQAVCLPVDAQCDCTPVAAALAMATPCHADNGTACEGVRECGPDGLSACDADVPATERCNGRDDDCDGDTDEGFGALGQPCADPAGGCADGAWSCGPDEASVVCLGASGPRAELCDGQDQDCDGETDEGCDADGDDYCAGGAVNGALSPACPLGFGDCRDDDAEVHPQAAEACNAKDDDCDGATDGLARSCDAGCGSGTQSCPSGSWSPCSGPPQVCSPGDPCCQASGCGYAPPSQRCSSTATATERQCSGSCGGVVQVRHEFRYCSGAASSCGTGNLQWEGWANETACGANNRCVQSGSSASCQTCPMGCAGGQCITQPTHVICIDPGYGPSNSPESGGASGHAVTWSVAQHLKAWLESDAANVAGGGTWSVVLTRSATSTPTASQRKATCDAAGATRVISIGVNGFNGSANGSETYRKSTTDATWTAYANLIHAQVIAKGGRADRGVKVSTTFTILTTAAPSVWTFLGFLDHAGDRAQLQSDTWRREVARGLLHGLQQSLGYAVFTP